jgi:hypothetical protein
MKTTVDIPEPLLAEARSRASQDGTTLRALVEEGLRRVLEERETRRRFALRDASVGGNGLQPSYRGTDWDEIRAAAYSGRGE